MDVSSNGASARIDTQATDIDVRPMRGPTLLPPDRLAGRPLLASLRDFGRAGLRPGTPLQRTIVAALCIKLLMIIALWAFVSLATTRVEPTDHAVARMIGIEPH